MYSVEVLNAYMRYFEEWLGIPRGILTAIAMQESSYNPTTGTFRNICNSSRACGLMQLKPIALEDIYRVYKIRLNPLDPIQGIVGAALLFRINMMYLRKYGYNVWSLVAAYHGGWTVGRKYIQGLPIDKDSSYYVMRVYNNFYQFRG